MMLVEPGTAVDTTGETAWTPVQVVAHLAEPVAALDSNALHLDGPASWGAFLAHSSERGVCALPPMTDGECVDFALPLACWTAPAPQNAHRRALAADTAQVWGWACSAGVWEPHGWSTTHLRRRPAVDEGARYSRDGKWHLSAGPTKARDTPVATTILQRVTWWALADPPALLDLLRRVHGLGRHVRHGHGRVLEWTVEEDVAAWRRWRDRVWPHPGGHLGAIRAPYHHPTRRMPCR
jgi:hypothetical protein